MIHLNDANVHRVAAPKKRWRIIGGAFSNYAELHYFTQAERDAGAQRLADEYREPVICEFWSFANSHDELNRGWASDGTIQPSVRKES